MQGDGAYSLFQMRRDPDSPRPRSISQVYSKPGSLATDDHGSKHPTHEPLKLNPPLRYLSKDQEPRKPLYDLLFQAQPKQKTAVGQFPKSTVRSQQSGGGRSNDPVPSNGSEYASSPLRVPSMPRSSEPPGAIEAEDADDGAWVSRLLATNTAYKRANKRLKDEVDSLKRAYDRVALDRDNAEARTNSSRQKASELKAMSDSQALRLSDCEARLAESEKRADSAERSLDEARNNVETLTKDVSVKEIDYVRLRDQMSTITRRLQSVIQSFNDRCTSFTDLQERHQALVRENEELKATAESIRASVRDAMQANGYALQSDGWLTSLRESKSIINEMQANLDSSKEVTTILRDKLHHMASVVAESNLRIQELEEEKKTAFTKLHQDYEELTSRFERSEGLEVKVERLTDRLVLRESETFDYLATAVGVEEKLEGARAEITRLTNVVNEMNSELTSLRSAKEEHLDKLLAAQEVTNGKEKEISGLRSELKALNDTQAELRALWLEGKKTIAEKDEELLKRAINPELLVRLQDVTSQFESCQTDLISTQKEQARLLLTLNASSQELEGLRARHEELQAAFETQAKHREEVERLQNSMIETLRQENAMIETSWGSKLREMEARLAEQCTREEERLRDERMLAQERIAEGNKRTHERQESHDKEISALKATIVERVQLITDSLSQEKKTLEKRCEELSNALSECALKDKEHMGAVRELEASKVQLEASLVQCQGAIQELRSANASEYKRMEDMFEKQIIAQKAVTEGQESRAKLAEMALALALKSEATEKSNVVALTDRLDVVAAELQRARETIAEQADLLSTRRSPVDDEACRSEIDSLSRELVELREQSSKILDRYKAGALSDVEKGFVRHLLSIAESMHEQNLVEKDQEIKSRETQIVVLQQRVMGLEKTLAQMLRNQAGEARSMMNLQTMVSSSPKDSAMDIERNAETRSEVETNKVTGQGMPKPQSSRRETGPSNFQSGKASPHPKFSKLAVQESDDDHGALPSSPLSSEPPGPKDRSFGERKMVKKPRMSSPPPPAPSATTNKRRAKASTTTRRNAKSSTSVAGEPKTGEQGATKNKSLKRKQ